MGRQRVSTTSNLELHTKEVVDESLDKALELFATKKVDSTFHLYLNQLASPLNGRSRESLNLFHVAVPCPIPRRDTFAQIMPMFLYRGLPCPGQLPAAPQLATSRIHIQHARFIVLNVCHDATSRSAVPPLAAPHRAMPPVEALHCSVLCYKIWRDIYCHNTSIHIRLLIVGSNLD
jgi:hypothetical protein